MTERRCPGPVAEGARRAQRVRAGDCPVGNEDVSGHSGDVKGAGGVVLSRRLSVAVAIAMVARITTMPGRATR